MKVAVIMPCLNEEKNLPLVVAEIPKKSELTNVEKISIIVVDNGSEDSSKKVAESLPVVSISERQMGYGSACLRGLEYVAQNLPNTDIIVFLDSDHSDNPKDLLSILDPIAKQNSDFVIGSRTLKNNPREALKFAQRYGNWLTCTLIWILFQKKFTDLGPFRAIKYQSLLKLKMEDRGFGWNVEMQVKALKLGFKITEVPVSYKLRSFGYSKISGNLKTSFVAGKIILGTLWKLKNWKP